MGSGEEEKAVEMRRLGSDGTGAGGYMLCGRWDMGRLGGRWHCKTQRKNSPQKSLVCCVAFVSV